MTYVMPDGFLRFYRRKNVAVARVVRFLASFSFIRRKEAMSDHLMRDVGLLDGRRTPGVIGRQDNRDVWSAVREPPRYL